MDLLSIIVVGVFALLLAIICSHISGILNSPQAIGSRGEEAVAAKLKDKKRIVRNIYLPTSNGHPVEVDIAHM